MKDCINMKFSKLFITVMLITCMHLQWGYSQTGFIENKGQIIDQNNQPNPEVKFLLNLQGLNVQLKQNSFSYDAYVIEKKRKENWIPVPGHPEHSDSFERLGIFHRIDIRFEGANASPQMITGDPGQDYLNYYTTATPEEGILFVRHYHKITYKNLYPGIDLEFVADRRNEKPVEFNFIVHPGADISQIRWKYEGSREVIVRDNKIAISTIHGYITESIPNTYEKETQKSVALEYRLTPDGFYTFSGKYNTNHTLIIDPIPDVIWSTYYGDSGRDKVNGVSYDSLGNVYITGETTSTSNMATSGAHMTTYGGGTAHYNWGGDAFVAKLTSTGTRVWATYYGGTSNDQGNCIKTSKNGDSYVAGCTESTSGIATSGAFQTSRPSSSYHNPFLVKFNSSGVRQWGTYYGSGGNDHTFNNTIAFDKSGNIYITGSANCVSSCQTITTSGCYQAQNSASGTGNAYNDAFVAKFSPSGSLIWGTYYGGNRGGNQASHDEGDAIYVDDSNYVYITGSCQSSVGIATTNAYQTSFGGAVGTYDAFIAKFNSTGSALKWATYYGDSGNDYGRGITADDSGNVYVSGFTASTSSFTTSGAFQTSYAGGTYDAFLAKFTKNCSRVWGTYFGGSGSDILTTLSLSPSKDLISTGYIDSASASAGLATSGSYKSVYAGGTQDGIIVKFGLNGSRKWCSYFGGNQQDLIYCHEIDQSGNIYIGGLTFSTSGIATSGTYQTTYSSQEDGFVSKILDQPVIITSATTIQPDTSATPAGTKNKMIIGIKINTVGGAPYAKVTQFSFDTAGVFSFTDITGTAKVYYTGNSPVFNTNKLFDSTSTTPSSAFTISGNQLLDTGTVYFWLTFDVKFSATVGHYLDAKCTQIKWDSGGISCIKVPSITSPAGKIRITEPLKTLNSLTISQPSTDMVYRYSNDNPVLRIDLNVIGTAGTLPLNQVKVVAKNTANSDVSNVKLYFTTSTTFSNSVQVGTTKTLSGDTVNFTALNFNLPTGQSYIWVTYDIPGTAVLFDTVDALIPASGLNIGGKTYPSVAQNPAGYRLIYTNFQYDAGISGIISPSAPYCKTVQQVKVTLRNYGTTTLTSDTIRWSVNGVMQTPYVWNGSLTTGNSVDLILGSYTFSMGTSYVLKVYTSYFNGTYNDNYCQNDTAIRSNIIFYPVPVAGFSVNDTFQCLKGNNFVFTNTSTIGSGSFSSFWNFGDNSTSSAASPSHSYQGVDTYLVKLVVTSAYGCPDSFSRNVYLKPNQTSDFSVSDTSLCLHGNMFSFTNATTFSSGTFTSLWKFGDNTTSTAANPSHSYNSAGNYQVRLITTTNTGCIDSIDKTLHVNPHPSTQFQFISDTAQCYSQNVFKTNNQTTISAGTFTSFWNFGDNTTSTNVSPVKSYASAGTYVMKLTTTSDYGCSDSFSRMVIVYPNPVTVFSINDSSQCNIINSFIFTNQSSVSSGTLTSTWDFGDNSGSTQTSPSKNYQTAGVYSVKLVTKSNFGCLDSMTKNVYVRPKPQAAFLINDSDQCLKGNRFEFNNMSGISSGSLTSSWNFGDNTVSTAVSPVKSYTKDGTFAVKLIATSNFGCKDSISKNVHLYPQANPSFTINDSEQCFKSNTFVFTNTSSIPYGTFTSYWNFGDNNTSTVSSPVYSYTSEGIFKPMLITTSGNGCKDTLVRQVSVHPSPVSYFTQGVNPQCLESNLFYMDNHSYISSGSIVHHKWYFGDGDSIDQVNPQHKYKTTGTFKILLKVISDKGCTDTSTKMVEVIPQPVAGMTVNDTSQCIRNHVFQFSDDSKTASGSITNYIWYFGDGKTSTQKNPAHTYAMTKTYTVTHIVTSSNGCRDTVTQKVYVFPMPVADFSIEDTNQCLKENHFKATNNSTGSGNLRYLWSFGNSQTSGDKNPVFSYSQSGIYPVSLVVLNENDCADTMEKAVVVRQSPVVNLGRDTTLYHNQSIVLNAGSGYDKYLWSNNDTTESIVVDTNGIGLDHPTLFWVRAMLNNCEDADSIVITFIHNVSIENLPNDIRIAVYPNPANQFVRITADRVMERMEVEISDLNGKVLISEKAENSKYMDLNISQLAEGIYFVNINGIRQFKLVKIKSR
ncbi:MAG TPA: PKD domain-containing protein [Bacteroidia bacterium]|nr:PKD domain-containing protein [Bacteroidia bacterium]HRS59893.1 PKD domain-containing protein [Bacteroidia bacterium]HRU68321.1 PKD domain-containing protein [Bacteroidia bacterium]